jgi:hypothetical protein
MTFYKLDQVTVSRDDQVFKASPTSQIIGLIITSGVILTLLVLAIRCGIHRQIVPAFFCCAFAGMFGLFALNAYGSSRASRMPSNWLLRCHARGLLIHYRSYRNWRFPADAPQVVGFDYPEIAWVRVAKERRIVPSMAQHGANSSETHFMTFVELGLANPDTSELERQLGADRNLGTGVGMVVGDYPVQVLPGGIVQMSWSGMHPSAHHAVECLGRHVKITEPDHRVVDLTYHSKTPPGEERQKILQLVRSGDVLAAVTMAQQVYGYSLTEAHNFVEKLKSEA